MGKKGKNAIKRFLFGSKSSGKIENQIELIKPDIQTSDPKVMEKIPQIAVAEASRMQAEDFNKATSGKHFENEVRWSFYNHHILMTALGYKYNKKEVTWRKYNDNPRATDMADAPRHKDQPILIIGSGPTFDDMAPYLKDWKGDIMVSTSQAATCCYLGKEPTYIMALDPNSFMAEMQVDSWKERKTILITHPGITPNLMNEWKGPIYLFRKLQPQTPFYNTEQVFGYSTTGERFRGQNWVNAKSLIKGQIPMLACVLAAQICAAKQLGYGRQYLIGADLGMPNDQARFTSYSYQKNKWVKSEPPNVEEWVRKTARVNNEDPILITEAGTPTTRMMVFYAHQVVTAWRLTEADMVSTSDKGIISILPFTTAEEIIRKQGQGIKGFNKKKIIWESEKYLARQNIYFLYLGKGIMPHEFKDPLHDVPKMLDEVERVLAAQNKSELFDKQANLRRIHKLFDEMGKGK